MRLYQRGPIRWIGKGKGRRQAPRPWWIAYTVNRQHHRQTLRTRDREVAQYRAAEMQKEIRMRELGIETFADTRNCTLQELAKSFLLELARRGRAQEHMARVRFRLGHMLEGAQRLRDVTSRRLGNKLQVLSVGGKSPKTCNEYRSAVHSFFAWLVKTEQWDKNPAVPVQCVPVTQRTRDRRALTEDELTLLVEHAGRDRGGIYLVAARTGLRRGELRQLRWRDVDLEAGVFRVRAVVSKDRREATLPLCPGAAQKLQERRATLDPDALVFRSIPRVHTLKKDLEAAGIAYKTAEGFADFHAFRHTFNTHLARAGVTLAMRQHLMRHSDPKLTANVYMHLELEDARAALGALGAPPISTAATGSSAS